MFHLNINIKIAMFLFTIVLVFVSFSFSQEQDSSFIPGELLSSVPFKGGFCEVYGPLTILTTRGAEFSFGPTVKFKGNEFQVQKPESDSAFIVSSIYARRLSSTKKPLSLFQKINCTKQSWNKSLSTIDFSFAAKDISILIQTYMSAFNGQFIIKSIKCISLTSPTK